MHFYFGGVYLDPQNTFSRYSTDCGRCQIQWPLLSTSGAPFIDSCTRTSAGTRSAIHGDLFFHDDQRSPPARRIQKRLITEIAARCAIRNDNAPSNVFFSYSTFLTVIFITSLPPTNLRCSSSVTACHRCSLSLAVTVTFSSLIKNRIILNNDDFSFVFGELVIYRCCARSE